MASYEDVRQIGMGGFGEVWLCRRIDDRVPFAKKILQPGMLPDDVKRFVREVRILSSLDHPNIIKVIEKDFHEEPYFYIMPLYKTSLRIILPALVENESRIFSIFSAILNGIDYAHSQGVIHRDLKPENVLGNSDTDIVLSDFGLGRFIDADSTRLTNTGDGMGTRLYLAPEQMTDAKRATNASDIYSLGRMLYELYTGPLTPAVQDTSTLPPGIALIVTRCTRPDPKQRFNSVSELKQMWLSLFDITQRHSEIDEIRLISAQSTVEGPENNEQIDRLLNLVAKYANDPDFLHETIMQLDPIVADAMYNRSPVLVKQLIEQFVDLAVSQSWAFEYTDKIGRKCRGLFDAIADPELRAMLVDCVMQVGVSHNRWYVLGIFSDLLERPKENGEEVVLVDRLQNVHESIRQHASGYVNLAKLHPTIQPLFTFDDNNGW